MLGSTASQDIDIQVALALPGQLDVALKNIDVVDNRSASVMLQSFTNTASQFELELESEFL